MAERGITRRRFLEVTGATTVTIGVKMALPGWLLKLPARAETASMEIHQPEAGLLEARASIELPPEIKDVSSLYLLGPDGYMIFSSKGGNLYGVRSNSDGGFNTQLVLGEVLGFERFNRQGWEAVLRQDENGGRQLLVRYDPEGNGPYFFGLLPPEVLGEGETYGSMVSFPGEDGSLHILAKVVGRDQAGIDPLVGKFIHWKVSLKDRGKQRIGEAEDPIVNAEQLGLDLVSTEWDFTHEGSPIFPPFSNIQAAREVGGGILLTFSGKDPGRPGQLRTGVAFILPNHVDNSRPIVQILKESPNGMDWFVLGEGRSGPIVGKAAGGVLSMFEVNPSQARLQYIGETPCPLNPPEIAQFGFGPFGWVLSGTPGREGWKLTIGKGPTVEFSQATAAQVHDVWEEGGSLVVDLSTARRTEGGVFVVERFGPVNFGVIRKQNLPMIKI